MSLPYLIVDGALLDEREERLYRGFLNASLNAIVTMRTDEGGEDLAPAQAAGLAIDHADAMVRELRERTRPKPPVLHRYRLVDDLARIEAWMAERSRYTPAQNRVVEMLRASSMPMTLDEIQAATGAWSHSLAGLVRDGFLVPVEEDAGAR